MNDFASEQQFACPDYEDDLSRYKDARAVRLDRAVAENIVLIAAGAL
jgi:hypothetical protein